MTWGKSISVGTTAALLALALARVAGEAGGHVAGMPLPVLVVAIAFAMQWIAFVPAAAARTEHFFDLWGSMTYLVCMAVVTTAAEHLHARDLLLATLVSIWALRLGTFLFARVRKDGRDIRFDDIKRSAPRFFVAWSLQGLWVSLTLLAVVTSISASESPALGLTDLAGVALWATGFAIESIADHQKRAFRKKRYRSVSTQHGFITTGLWAWSRHPNYFGEVLLWLGLSIIATATFSGWAWIGLVSPIFVFALLRFGSGVPLLEERADDRFGHIPAYQAYKRRTPIFFMLPPREEGSQ